MKSQTTAPGDFFPSSHGFDKAEQVFYEYLGILWTLLRGRYKCNPQPFSEFSGQFLKKGFPDLQAKPFPFFYSKDHASTAPPSFSKPLRYLKYSPSVLRISRVCALIVVLYVSSVLRKEYNSGAFVYASA